MAEFLEDSGPCGPAIQTSTDVCSVAQDLVAGDDHLKEINLSHSGCILYLSHHLSIKTGNSINPLNLNCSWHYVLCTELNTFQRSIGLGVDVANPTCT